jgi:hypothetical protein
MKRVGSPMWNAAAKVRGRDYDPVTLLGLDVDFHTGEPARHEALAGSDTHKLSLVQAVTEVDFRLPYLIDQINATKAFYLDKKSTANLRLPGFTTEFPFRMPQRSSLGDWYSITRDFRLSVKRSSLNEILFEVMLIGQRDYIDLSLLRICPICDRLFIAGRRDAMACSPNCASRERQRRYRDPAKQKAYREKRKRTRLLLEGAKRRTRVHFVAALDPML